MKKNEEDEFNFSKDLQSLVSETIEDDNNLKSIDLILKQKQKKNLNLFCGDDIDEKNMTQIFEKECKITNEYNNLRALVADKDMFEYSLMGKKNINTKFIRCLDFFKKGKSKINFRFDHFCKLEKPCVFV